MMTVYRSSLQQLHDAAFHETGVPFELGYSQPLWGDPRITASAPTKEPAPAPEVSADAGELAPVVTAPEPEISPDARARKLLSAAMTAIAEADLSGDESLQSRGADLLGEVSDLSSRLGKFLSDARERKIESLTRQHEAAALACREQTAVIAGVEQRHTEQIAELRKLAGQTATARALFNACDAREPDLDSWPNRAEVAQWKAERARLAQVLEQAQDAESAGRGELARIAQEFRREQEKLTELSEAESVLRSRLSGESFFDGDTGLIEPREL